MSETFDPIAIVKMMAQKVAEQRDAEIALVIFQLAADGVDHALIHLYEWSEPAEIDLEQSDFKITTQLAFRPEVRDEGGYQLGLHPYGQKPEDLA